MTDISRTFDTLQEYANKRFIETFEKYEQFYLSNFNEIQELQDQIRKRDLEIQRLTELLEAKQPKPEPKPEPQPKLELEPEPEPEQNTVFVDETVAEFLFKQYVNPKKQVHVVKGVLYEEYSLFCIEQNFKALKRPDFYKEILKTGIQEKRTNKTRLFDINFEEDDGEPIQLKDVKI
jgi:hypothetical protein